VACQFIAKLKCCESFPRANQGVIMQVVKKLLYVRCIPQTSTPLIRDIAIIFSVLRAVATIKLIQIKHGGQASSRKKIK